LKLNGTVHKTAVVLGSFGLLPTPDRLNATSATRTRNTNRRDRQYDEGKKKTGLGWGSGGLSVSPRIGFIGG